VGQINVEADELSLQDWTLLGYEAVAFPEQPTREIHAAGLALHFDAERRVGYNLWQVVLPLSVVVLLLLVDVAILPSLSGALELRSSDALDDKPHGAASRCGARARFLTMHVADAGHKLLNWALSAIAAPGCCNWATLVARASSPPPSSAPKHFDAMLYAKAKTDNLTGTKLKEIRRALEE